MKLFRHGLALCIFMPASAFATFKYCDIYQGQIMDCRATITVASDIPVYRDNHYRNCYIQAGKAIYCDGLATVTHFPVLSREGYRDCDIRSGVITSCGVYTSGRRVPVAISDDDPGGWQHRLKFTLCLLPAPLSPHDCSDVPPFPDAITFF